ncbi:MBL fold metallo-hydrolase [Enterobacteriaceae bacterium RIT691]|nr:MBL fold metallo-hydrolase [Enterobacteriaceae bacterium RIT691]
MKQPASTQIGDYRITVLSDGKMSASLELLSGIETAEAGKIQQQAGVLEPGSIHINAYLIQVHGKTILVDSGTGGRNNVGGELQQSLHAAGVAPEDIDIILLTHAHPDHVGGLLDAEERRVFANAQLYLHPREARYWLDDEKRQQAPERAQRNFALARRVLSVYESSLHYLKPDERIEGIRVVELPGHTPGHTGFRVDAQGHALLIWGDIVHFPHIQTTRPAVSIAFDCDPVQAEATRQKTFRQAFEENLLIAGMHLGIEGFARLTQRADGYQLIYAEE